MEIGIDTLREGFNANKKCYSCVHRGTLPGTHHSQCAKKTALVGLNQHGVKNGWACWPFNFDPIWVNQCDSYLQKGQPDALNGTPDELKFKILIQLKYQFAKFNALKEQGRFREAEIVAKTYLLLAQRYTKLNEPNEEELKTLLFDLLKM